MALAKNRKYEAEKTKFVNLVGQKSFNVAIAERHRAANHDVKNHSHAPDVSFCPNVRSPFCNRTLD